MSDHWTPETSSLFLVTLANARLVSSSTILPMPTHNIMHNFEQTLSPSITGFPIERLLKDIFVEENDPIAAERHAVTVSMRARQFATIEIEAAATAP